MIMSEILEGPFYKAAYYTIYTMCVSHNIWGHYLHGFIFSCSCGKMPMSLFEQHHGIDPPGELLNTS